MPYKDPAKQKAAQQRSYAKHKLVVRKRWNKVRLSNAAIVEQFKQQNPCSCGECDIRCLDLHHNDEKSFGIAHKRRHVSTTKLLEEMKKCEVICANCHRKLHKDDEARTTTNLKRIRNREFLNEFKSNHPCVECGESEIVCLDLHHLRDKAMMVSEAVLHCGLDTLKAEIDKCKVLCANCHRKTHIRVRA